MRKLLFCTLLTAVAASVSPAQTVRGIKTFIAMGDSIGEGVQSGDSNSATQPNSYLKLVASRLRVPFPLPLIATTPISTVESTNGRSRIVASTQSPNLAVSGADTGSALTDQADGVVNEEVDLVLAPRLGAQIDVAETTPSDLMVYWLGNNDALSAILAFDHLDASQLTPVNVFYANLDEGLRRLKAAGKTKVVVGNLINIPQIAFTFDATQLRAFAGSDFGLPAGSRTSLIAALLLRSGIAPANLLRSPDWVLDANELAAIQSRIDSFNAIIAERAAFYGYPVVDVKAAFDAYMANPPIVAGVPVTNGFNGGMFSLDGVHPSNTGHALVANLFLATINQAYGLALAPYSQSELDTIGAADPFLDLDGDGVVRGRPLKGLFETLGPFFGVSGDTEGVKATAIAGPQNAKAALARYHQLMGITSPQGTQMEQAVRMFKQIVSWGPKH
jgi:lysophospholipase L1-like esterase